MLIAEALASCTTVEDASEFFQQTPRTGGGLLMLGDPSGEIAAVEISNGQVVRRDAQNDRLAHSNRYCCAPMRQLEVHEEAMYAKNHALNGRRVHQSSELPAAERTNEVRSRGDSESDVESRSRRQTLGRYNLHARRILAHHRLAAAAAVGESSASEFQPDVYRTV